MAAKSTELCYKGHPLRRKDNLLYYGSMADKYIIMMQILDTKKIKDLDLRRPIYRQLAAYGHMGREELGVRWEDTDRTDALRAAVAKTNV